MQLIHLSTPTPLGEFSLILSRGKDGAEVVVASGFENVKKLSRRCGIRVNIERGENDHPYGVRVRQYFAGAYDALDALPVHMEGGVFQKAVWESMKDIPAGKVSSYKAIAEAIKRPKAFRAVGSACGANHLILLVPCHRIVRSDGALGEYVYGTKRKAQLLAHEQGSRI